MIDDDEKVTMIDFPQMVSVSHRNAHMYFDRDVECIFKFFRRRFNLSVEEQTAESDGSDVDSDEIRPCFSSITKVTDSLDKELAASGFTRKDQDDIEKVHSLEHIESVELTSRIFSRFDPPVILKDFVPLHEFPIPLDINNKFADTPPPEIPPPQDNNLKLLIEGVATLVARCGKLFEDLSREKNQSNPLFSFFNGGNGHDYYSWKL